MHSNGVPAVSGARAETRQASCTTTSASVARSRTSSQTRVSPEITTTPADVVTRYATASRTGSWCTPTASTMTEPSAFRQTSTGAFGSGVGETLETWIEDIGTIGNRFVAPAQ
jgi:hypothetical protein